MKKIIFLWATIFALITSCNDRENAETESVTTLKEIVSTTINQHKISLKSKKSGLFVGYNEIFVSITDAQTGANITPEKVIFYPEMSMYGQDKTTISHKHTCPHQSELSRDGNHYKGFSIFQMHTGDMGFWDAKIKYTHNGKEVETSLRINVQEQSNKALGNVVRFRIDGKMHILTIVSPETPKIGSNTLKMGLFRMDSMSSFPMVEGYTLKLDPRMTGEEMGNHSSPNNKDLTQGSDGFYHGIVNYTMTGHWTLNFILVDKNGNVVAGSEVPSPEKIKECKCDYDKKSSVAVDLNF